MSKKHRRLCRSDHALHIGQSATGRKTEIAPVENAEAMPFLIAAQCDGRTPTRQADFRLSGAKPADSRHFRHAGRWPDVDGATLRIANQLRNEALDP
ncbi:hypothetical protein [Rhodopseudomonas palustris]|nr:hypothetical protein [Rhodopseudomonas palustris]